MALNHKGLATSLLTIVNNNPTNIKYINKIEKLELTTDQYIKDQVNNLTIDHIKKGCVGYAEYAIKHPFKNRIMCRLC